VKLSITKQQSLLSKFETGAFYGLAESVYRADSALSTSDLKLIDNPYHFHQKITGKAPAIDSPAMAFGRLAHSYILERDEFDKIYSVCPEDKQDRRLKANREWWSEQAEAGKQIVKQSELDSVKAIADRFWKLPVVRDIKDFHPEVSVFAKDYRGICDVKCRIDMKAGPVVIDLKTTRGGGADPRQFVRTARSLKYLWQQCNYTDMCKAAGIEIAQWYWAVVETEWPYRSSLLQFTEFDLESARRELDEAYDSLKSCLTLKAWPDYTPDEPLTVSAYGFV